MIKKILWVLGYFSLMAQAHDWRLPAAVTGVLSVPYIVLVALNPPKTCNWCDAPSGFDLKGSENAHWSNPEAADILSSVLGFGLLPAYAVASAVYRSADGCSWEELDKNKLAFHIFMNAAGLMGTLVTTEAMKRGFARERPWIYFNRTDASSESDGYVSFPSGHTSMSIALSVGTIAETVLHMKNDNKYEYLSALMFPLSGFVGYLRVAAVKHWPTDVIAGTGVGLVWSILNQFFLRLATQNAAA